MSADQRAIEYREVVLLSFRCLALSILLLLSLAPIGRAADTLHVAKPEATTFAFAFLDIGIKEGIFEQYGLDIETVVLAGAAKADQALIAGSVDVELGSGVEFIYIVRGSPAKGIAVLAGAPLGLCLTVRDDGSIKDVADLKGKLIGISTAGSLSDWLAETVAIRRVWGKDGVTRVALGDQDSLSAALVSKNIDALVGGTQTAYRLQAQGRGHMLANFGTIVPDFITHMILSSDSFIAAHPDELKRFLAAWFETVRFAKTHKDAAVRDTMPSTRLSPELAATTYDEQIAMFSDDGRFVPKGLEVTKAAVRELGALETLPADNALFTEAFLPPRDASKP